MNLLHMQIATLQFSLGIVEFLMYATQQHRENAVFHKATSTAAIARQGKKSIWLACRSHFQHNMKGDQIAAQPLLAKAGTSFHQKKARAAIVVLARNHDCDDVLLSMSRMEQRFNHKYQYPYVFLNNQPFDAAFQSRYTGCLMGCCPMHGHVGLSGRLL